MLDIAIECRGDLPQRRLLLGEARGNRALRHHRVFALRELAATRRQPNVQRLEAGEARQRREQPFADVADLVLNLPLLPTRCRRTGYWLEQIMISQHHEAPVELPLLGR